MVEGRKSRARGCSRGLCMIWHCCSPGTLPCCHSVPLCDSTPPQLWVAARSLARRGIRNGALASAHTWTGMGTRRRWVAFDTTRSLVGALGRPNMNRARSELADHSCCVRLTSLPHTAACPPYLVAAKAFLQATCCHCSGTAHGIISSVSSSLSQGAAVASRTMRTRRRFKKHYGMAADAKDGVTLGLPFTVWHLAARASPAVVALLFLFAARLATMVFALGQPTAWIACRGHFVKAPCLPPENLFDAVFDAQIFARNPLYATCRCEPSRRRIFWGYFAEAVTLCIVHA